MNDSAASQAARLRAERDELVAAIAAGRVPVEAIGADPRAAAVKVVVLAQAVPGVGKVRSRRVLEGLGVEDSARWGELPTAVEARLVAGLRHAATADGA